MLGVVVKAKDFLLLYEGTKLTMLSLTCRKQLRGAFVPFVSVKAAHLRDHTMSFVL